MPSGVEASLDFSCRTQTDSRLQLNAEHSTLNAQRSDKKTAGGGARTHTILRSLDFESSASANSATPAQGILKLRSPQRSSSGSGARRCVCG